MSEAAKAPILELGLKPHPEGGWYRETWRAAADDGARAGGSAILYLLEKGQKSHWHRIESSEIWLFQAGHALTLRSTTDATVTETCLGANILAGDVPQFVVAPGQWQAAEAVAGWALVACIVVPAFEFAHFELAPAGWTPDGEMA